MKLEKLLEIHRIVAQENPELAERLFEKDPNRLIIGNVDFLYTGPDAGHQYITLDGTLELQFWMKGADIPKIYIPYEDALEYPSDVTVEIKVLTPNPRIRTLELDQKRIDRLLVHFKQQMKFKDVKTDILPYVGLNIQHPMRLHVDKGKGLAATSNTKEIYSALKEKYTLAWLKKVNIDTLSPEQLEDVIKYFRGKPKSFYTTPEYKAIYPYLQKIHKRSMSFFKKAGEVAMKSAGIEYGDTVHYDHADLLFGVNRMEGIVIKRNGVPYVKLTRGRTSDGRKQVMWHKGWIK